MEFSSKNEFLEFYLFQDFFSVEAAKVAKIQKNSEVLDIFLS